MVEGGKKDNSLQNLDCKWSPGGMELGKLSRYRKEIGLPDKRFVYLRES
jgi:hypothetical protein